MAFAILEVNQSPVLQELVVYPLAARELANDLRRRHEHKEHEGAEHSVQPMPSDFFPQA